MQWASDVLVSRSKARCCKSGSSKRKYITITKGGTNHQPPVFTIAIREVVGLVAGASGAEVVVVAPFKVRTTLDLSASLERSLKSYDKERGSQDTVIHAWRGRWRKEHIMSSMTAMVWPLGWDKVWEVPLLYLSSLQGAVWLTMAVFLLGYCIAVNCEEIEFHRGLRLSTSFVSRRCI